MVNALNGKIAFLLQDFALHVSCLTSNIAVVWNAVTWRLGCSAHDKSGTPDQWARSRGWCLTTEFCSSKCLHADSVVWWRVGSHYRLEKKFYMQMINFSHQHVNRRLCVVLIKQIPSWCRWTDLESSQYFNHPSVFVALTSLDWWQIKFTSDCITVGCEIVWVCFVGCKPNSDVC